MKTPVMTLKFHVGSANSRHSTVKDAVIDHRYFNILA